MECPVVEKNIVKDKEEKKNDVERDDKSSHKK